MRPNPRCLNGPFVLVPRAPYDHPKFDFEFRSIRSSDPCWEAPCCFSAFRGNLRFSSPFRNGKCCRIMYTYRGPYSSPACVCGPANLGAVKLLPDHLTPGFSFTGLAVCAVRPCLCFPHHRSALLSALLSRAYVSHISNLSGRLNRIPAS